MSFQVGDTVSYEGHNAVVDGVFTHKWGEHRTTFSIKFIYPEDWEWWYGEDWDWLMDEYGEDGLEAEVDADEVVLVTPVSGGLTLEDCM